jgi:hypothetical protein
LADLVETYSGHRVHERPLRFQVEGAWKTVVDILPRRREPGALRFTVLADDGRRYGLYYNQEDDVWKVTILPQPGGLSPPV